MMSTLRNPNPIAYSIVEGMHAAPSFRLHLEEATVKFGLDGFLSYWNV